MLAIGSHAPDFTADLGSGGRFTLSEHRGRNVVIYFYPRAFTHGCTVQTRGFGKAHDLFSELDAVVLGVSTDDVETLRRFGDSCAAPFGLASDSAHEIRRLYDVERRLRLGTSRVTYVIDADGVIRDAIHNEISMSSHVRRALRALEDAGHARGAGSSPPG